MADARAARVEGHRVLVMIQAERGQAQAASAAATARGARISATYRDWIDAYVPAAALAALAQEASVHRIDLPTPMVPAVVGEGVSLINAPAWHDAGVTGAGVRVGIIDVGFESYTSLLGTELPASVDTSCSRRTLQNGKRHGTAVAEIVHEVAPAAQLFFATVSTGTETGIAMTCMASKGVTVINYSAGHVYSSTEGPGDGTGQINQVVNDAVAQGIFWANSAGNSADKHWSGQWSNSDGDEFLNFSGDDETQTVSIQADDTIRIGLRWNDPWGGACNDYGLALYDRALSLVASNNDRQDCSAASKPAEFLSYVAPTTDTYHIVIYRSGGNAVNRIDLITGDHRLQYRVAASSLLHPADNASSGMGSVGAVSWLSPSTLESFSSQGPTTDGRAKPDLVAPDFVTTAAEGFFIGTSAAAPHVAGAAALVKQANPDFTPAQIKTFFQSRAIDLGRVGSDNQFGAGRLDLGTAPVAGPTPASDNSRARSGPFNFSAAPGQQFGPFDIIFENTGTTTWRTRDGHVLREEVTAANFGLTAIECDGLPPGSLCNARFSTQTVRLGTTPGTYQWRFRMYRGGASFGDVITVTFVVTGPSPTPTRTPTVSPASPTPTPIPGPGGRGFGITPGNSVTLTWSAGTEQSGYIIVRITGGTTTILPPGGTLPPSATSFTDTAVLTEVTCYVLAVFGPGSSTRISDVLCLFPNSRVGDFPRNFTIRLNQSFTASFTWDPPAGGGQTRYTLSPLGASPINLPGTARNASHTMASFSCYTLSAATDTGTLGTTDMLCGIPGVTTLASHPVIPTPGAATPTPRPSSTPTQVPSPTASPSPTGTPVGAARRFGDGTFVVGVDIAPGTYRAPSGQTSCYWERLSGFSGEFGEIIANFFGQTPAVVTIKPSDRGFRSSRCGEWTDDLSPITSAPDRAFGAGTFIVGVDIAAGTWRSDATAAGCYWERLRGFSGEFEEIIANFFGSSPTVVTIRSSDRGFRSSRCGDWTRISA